MSGHTPTKTTTPTSTTSTSSPSVVDLFSRNLGRGKACEPCRRRKLRCDGVRPICARCQEAQTRVLNRMRRKGVNEEKIRATQFAPCFDTEDDEDSNHSGSAGVHQIQMEEREQNKKPAKQQRLNNNEGENAATQNDLFFAEILSSQLPMDVAPSSTKPTIEAVTAPRYQLEEGMADQRRLTAMLFSSSIDILPPLDKIRILFQVFFDTYPIYAVFQPSRLMERLEKGPEHEDYPHPSAIHTLLAIAYAQRPDLDETLDQNCPANARVGAHYRHTLAAQKSIFEATHHGETSGRFFDVTRALILLCFKQYGSADVLESYLSNSSSIRACISLNLNKDSNSVAMSEQQLLQQILQPRITDTSFMAIKPRDAVEAEEVRRTMLVAYASDRMCCATTLWPGTLSEEDYTTSLPRTTLKEFIEGSFGEEIMNRPPRHLNSHDFFTLKAADAEQMMFKGTVILGKCAELISRLPRDASKEYIASMPGFQRLESYITSLQLSVNAIINPTGGLGIGNTNNKNNNSVGALSVWLISDRKCHFYDGVIIASSSLPHACTLTLHEPFANLSEESEAVCRGACRSVIAILRLCSNNADTELARLHAIFVYVCGLAGRSLIRQLESLYSKLIAHEFTQSGPNASWDAKDFTDSVSLLQADLEVIL